MPTKRTATIVTAVGLAAVVAALANLGIGTLARSVTSVPQFVPLWPVVYIPFTFFAMAVGAIRWEAIRRNARRPTELLRWLVPTTVVVSFIPDVVLYFVTSVGVVPIAALMSMHVVVATVAVPVYAWVLPITVEPALAGHHQ